MEKNKSIIDSVAELLETITGKKVDLSASTLKEADFSCYLKSKPTCEMGGHMPQKESEDQHDYCLSPKFVSKVMNSF